MKLFNWKKKKDKDPEEDFISNDPEMFFAWLLFDSEPEINDLLIEQELSKEFENMHFPDRNSESRHYFAHDFPVEYHEGSIPAQFIIYKPETGEKLTEILNKAYTQKWHWPEAKEETGKVKYAVAINDLMSKPLDYKVRLWIFQKFVSSITRAIKPKAIYFRNSEKLVAPSVYINEINSQNELYGVLNLRFFNIEGGGFLMDSLGMHAFGLPDFQFQFSEYEPGIIASLLGSYCQYIFEKGSVIKNGDTVEGLEKDSKWKCIYNSSVLEPVRNVLKIEEL